MAGEMNISAELNEFWRKCDEEELAVWFHDPALWSYVVRGPNGMLVCWGKAQTRAECEDSAIRNAEDFADENAMIVIRDGVKVPLL